MDDDYTKLIIGVIILILIVNTVSLWSVASIIYSSENDQKSGNSSNNSGDLLLSTTDTIATPQTTITPDEFPLPEPDIIPEMPTLEKTETPTIITIETPAIIETVPVPMDSYEPMVSERDTANLEYITIYSIENQIINNLSPDVSVNLKNPPLILDFTITPANISDRKYIEYKLISSMYYENITIDRPFENSWFLVTVTDKETGKIVAKKGLGREYGLEYTQRLILFRSGNYRFDFSGEFIKATLLMRVPRTGNFDNV